MDSLFCFAILPPHVTRGNVQASGKRALHLECWIRFGPTAETRGKIIHVGVLLRLSVMKISGP